MDPLRVAGIWLGVGAGHVALLVAAFGNASAPRPSDGGLLTLMLLAPDAPPVSSVPMPAPARVQGAEPRLAPPLPSFTSVAPAASAVAAAPVARPGAAGAEVAGEPPGFVDRVEPQYPRGARLAGIEGVVRLRLCVGADGALRRVELAKGSGDAALDRAAVAAATASTYRPARIGGRHVESEVESIYRFELR